MNRHFIGPLTKAQLRRRKEAQARYIQYVNALEYVRGFREFLNFITERKHWLAAGSPQPPAPGEYP